ncbi:unnamed protein product, partial [marine sediment metagenome]
MYHLTKWDIIYDDVDHLQWAARERRGTGEVT